MSRTAGPGVPVASGRPSTTPAGGGSEEPALRSRSILLPATRKVLAEVRPAQPAFSNAALAELFEQEHTRGDLTLLPCTAGGYVLFDRSAPLGKRGLGHFQASARPTRRSRRRPPRGST